MTRGVPCRPAVRSPEEVGALFDQHQKLAFLAIRMAFGSSAATHPLVRRIGGLDVVRQESLFQLWRCCCLYLPDKACTFATYALACLVRKIRGLPEEQQRRTVTLDGEREQSKQEWLADAVCQPVIDTLAGERAERVAQAVAMLPERSAAIIRMHFFDGLSLRQIGKRLGVTQVRIQQIKQVALARLRTLLVSKEASL